MQGKVPSLAPDWRKERARIIHGAKIVLIKVGSAVLANEFGLDQHIILDLASEIAAVCKNGPEGRRHVILVSSGAVAAGRAALRGYGCSLGNKGLAARQGAAAVGQGLLIHAWEQAFATHNLATAQVLLTRADFRSRERFLNARNTFAELLEWGVVPIVNENDTVSVNELKFGDNDCLASLLLNLVGADIFINLTSAAGVFAANPETDAKTSIIPCIADISSLDLQRLCGTKSALGSGGMRSKLMAARRAAQLGVPTLILPGRESGILRKALTLDNLEIGTWVCPARQSISRRKFWLAYKSEPEGILQVDAGAARALAQKGSSLLPGGISSVQGEFQKGALVKVEYAGEDLGVGLSNYSAAQLKKIIGLKRQEVAVALGDSHYPEVIHRDNFLLAAAL